MNLPSGITGFITIKILLVNDYTTPSYGSKKQILMLRDGLKQRGHNAELFASSAGSIVKRAIPAGYQFFGSASCFQALLQTVNPWTIWKFRRVMREFKPNIVPVRVYLTLPSPRKHFFFQDSNQASY